MSGLVQALDGVNILCFGGYAAGPHIGKLLGNFGATVVHVDSRQRPDGFRIEYPPFKDKKPGLNRSGCHAYFNDSKLGITLDLKNSEGLELAKSLIKWADVVVENMRPGVMDRLGLGYEVAKNINPSIIMLSSCNMGNTGPRAFTPGFGSQLSALAGFCGLTGVPDGPPMLLYGPYIDFIASTLGASAVVAALECSRSTGVGTWLDLSQYEAGLHFIAGALLDYHKTGTIAERDGNVDAEAAPHGAYRCRNDRWIVLSCWSDKEFEDLVSVIDSSLIIKDSRFKTVSGRQQHSDELDQMIGAWCDDVEAEQIVIALQQAGVHAYTVNTIADLFSDPQLLSRNIWRIRRHPVIGNHAYFSSSVNLSETPGDVMGAAPLLGEHNETVICEFLGFSEEEYNTYKCKGAFG